MRIAGLSLLVAGWLIVLSAIALLKPSPSQMIFILVSISIQVAGFVLLIRSHLPLRGDRD